MKPRRYDDDERNDLYWQALDSFPESAGGYFDVPEWRHLFELLDASRIDEARTYIERVKESYPGW